MGILIEGVGMDGKCSVFACFIVYRFSFHVPSLAAFLFILLLVVEDGDGMGGIVVVWNC